MTTAGVVTVPHNNNVGIWLGTVGVIEIVSEGWAGNDGINNTDLKIICQKVVAETLTEDKFSF